MKLFIVILITALTSGCTLSPPKLAEVSGEFQPINKKD